MAALVDGIGDFSSLYDPALGEGRSRSSSACSSEFLPEKDADDEFDSDDEDVHKYTASAVLQSLRTTNADTVLKSLKIREKC